MSNVKKFVLKFDFNDSKFSATCDNAEFERSLLCDKLSHEYAKTELIKQFIKSQNYNENTTQKIWFYDMKQNTNNTLTIYCAPRIDFKPCADDFETMSDALTTVKVPVSFFDTQIIKHLESVGVVVTSKNVRIYRASYKDQISKLLLSEILSKRTMVYVARWFDKINGNSHSSVSVFDGIYQINVPVQYGYGSAENMIIHALKLDMPRTMCSGEYLTILGMTVVDLGYGLKREMFQAAFCI